MTLKIGQIRKMRGGYDDNDMEVLVSAIGLQNVLYVFLPMVYFNGALEEHKMRMDKFKEQTCEIEQENN